MNIRYRTIRRDAPMLAATFVLTLSSGFAIAQGAFTRTPPTFDALDLDNNDSLSEVEVAAFLSELSVNSRNRPIVPEQMLARWDANKDGAVSRTEFDNRALSRGRSRAMPRTTEQRPR